MDMISVFTVPTTNYYYSFEYNDYYCYETLLHLSRLDTAVTVLHPRLTAVYQNYTWPTTGNFWDAGGKPIAQERRDNSVCRVLKRGIVKDRKT